jgi:hypothetical protein
MKFREHRGQLDQSLETVPGYGVLGFTDEMPQ